MINNALSMLGWREGCDKDKSGSRMQDGGRIAEIREAREKAMTTFQMSCNQGLAGRMENKR
jgi:hypothetical protein